MSAGRLGVALLAGACVVGAGAPARALDPRREITQHVRKKWTADDGLPHGPILAIAQSDDGYLWLGGDGGLVRFDGVRFVPADTTALPAPRRVQVDRLWRDADGTLWVASATHGMLTLRRGVLAPAAESTLGVSARSTRPSLVDRDGSTWTAGAGGALERRTREGVTSTLLLGGTPTAMFEDREGSLWIGTDAGLIQLRDGLFVTISPEEGLGYPHVEGVYAEGGDVWALTAAGTLERITGLRGRTVDGVGGARFYKGMTTDVHGRLLVGSHEGPLTTAGTPALDLRQGVAALGADGTDVWVATSDDGLHRIGPSGRSRYDAASGLPSNTMLSLLVVPGGAVWAGTIRGLARVEGGAVTSFAGRGGAAARPIADIHRDGAGRVWFGTVSGGLGLIDGERVVTIGSAQGLPDDTAGTILEDDAGRLWMCSNLGAWVVSIADLMAVVDGHKAKVDARTFSRADGMLAEECGGFGGARTSDGRLWFPTTQGVAVVDPAALTEPQPPAVMIEAVRADERALDPGRAELPPGTRHLAIEYTAATLAAPARARFRHRLVGLDAGWIDAGAARVARYTGLAAGRYRFEVAAVTPDGRAGVPAALELVVAPRLHETWWFMALCGLAVAGVVAALIRVRLARQAARARALEALVAARSAELGERNRELEERTAELDAALVALREKDAEMVRSAHLASVGTLARGIAHELNNPIHYLAGNVVPLERYTSYLLRVVRALGDGRARTEEELGELLRYGRNRGLEHVARDLTGLLADLNEGARRAELIVSDLASMTGGTRAVTSVDLRQAVEATARMLEPKLGGRRLVLDLADAAIPMRARSGELEQVVMNLVDNAIRAVGPEGTVTVRARGDTRAERIELSVTDDGAGMSPEVLRRACEPFFTTRSAGEGTGLGLAIVSSVVNAHRGTLDITSAPGSGTQVGIMLPREGIREGSSLAEMAKELSSGSR